MELIRNPAEVIIEMHLKCILSVKKSLDFAISIGEKLQIQKDTMDHGTFIPWIEETLPFSVRTAQNYLKLFSKKDALLAANVESVAEAYLLLAPKEKRIEKKEEVTDEESDGDTLVTVDKRDQVTQYKYWDHLGPLIENMDKVYNRLASLRDGTTPIALGAMIGNIKDMANVLQTWEPGFLDECANCNDGSCGYCVSGYLGIFQESEF